MPNGAVTLSERAARPDNRRAERGGRIFQVPASSSRDEIRKHLVSVSASTAMISAALGSSTTNRRLASALARLRLRGDWPARDAAMAAFAEFP